jgi:prevent-host-death family protein
MKVIEKADAKAPLAEYTAEVDKEPIIVTSKGKPIAALVSIENADLETVSLSTNPKFLELIERSRARQRAEGSISSEEMRRRLGVRKAKKG